MMNVQYSHDGDTLRLEINPTLTIDHAEHIGETIVHLSPDRQPVMIEITKAREFIGALMDSVMQPGVTAQVGK